MTTSKRLAIIGAGGHAAVVLEALNSVGAYEVAGMVDSAQDAEPVLGVPVIGHDSRMDKVRDQGVSAVALGIGANRVRERIGERLAEAGFDLPAVVHATALVSPPATIAHGAVVMARAVVGTRATIGRGAIVNTGAIIDHDCTIGAFAHVAPGAALCGNVRVGARAMIGVGTSIRPGIFIGDDAVVGAGSAVVADVPPGAVVGGAPARPLHLSGARA